MSGLIWRLSTRTRFWVKIGAVLGRCHLAQVATPHGLVAAYHLQRFATEALVTQIVQARRDSVFAGRESFVPGSSIIATPQASI